jgi:hypothetical protein
VTDYEVYAINPKKSSRYRELHATSGAKSDPGDAHGLAEIVRLDRATPGIPPFDAIHTSADRGLNRLAERLTGVTQSSPSTVREVR